LLQACRRQNSGRPAASLILTHVNIYTVDRQHPKAEAVAVIGDRIVAVGSMAEIDAWRGPESRVIDAHGKLLLPGFNDSHVHTLAFGTDWDVAPLNPLLGLYAAVTRATLDGKNPTGWIPEQKIRLDEAVQAYTLGSALAEFQEKEKGSITPGKLADIVILSDNIFDMKPEAIRNVKVETTIVGGEMVYSRPKP
jgi:predicted amidohydrolase YtcJ